MKKTEYNALNNETIETQMSEKEIKQFEKDQATDAAAKALAEAETEAKAQAKAAAEGKLAALGLTTDDLRALGL
jgi:hypothetical protein